MNRFTRALCNLILLGAALTLTTPALAGPIGPTPTPTATPTLEPSCGNGIVDFGEECDPPLTTEGQLQCSGQTCLDGIYGSECTCGWVDIFYCELDKKCSVGGSEPADQCEAMPGDEVTYTYIVGPVSAYEATVEVTDDKLGVVAADLLVPILGVVEFTATTTIFETTTNTARITAATSVACEIPSAGASVTVTVPGVATPTATPTPTAEPTATATATPPPGTSDCLCEVQNINPNQVVLQNVASGGKGSSATRKMTLIVHAVDAPGATCDPGEFSEPTSVNLMMVDDNGDAVFNDGKTIVCGGGGGTTNVKLDVFFQGPLNCEGGTVPPPKPGFSLGTITSTGTGSAGSTDYVESTSIKCFE